MRLDDLRHTYAELARTGILIRLTADEVEGLPRTELWDRLTEILIFVERELLPVMVAEEEVLYPAVDGVTETAVRTEVVRVDHEEISQLSEELGAALRALLVSEPQASAGLRRGLYGLHMAIRLHVRAVEEVLFPVLEAALAQHEGETLQAAMQGAAESAWTFPSRPPTPESC